MASRTASCKTWSWHFLVLSFDRFSRMTIIGEAMPLAGVDPSTGKVQLTRDIIKRNIQVSRKSCWGGTVGWGREGAEWEGEVDGWQKRGCREEALGCQD